MSCNLWIENPPPFRQAMRGEGETLAEIPMEEGEEIIKLFTDPDIDFAGFHHADLDRFEYGEKAMHKKIPLLRHDTFEYASYLKSRFNGQCSDLAPHRVVVYQSPEEQHDDFKRLWENGVQRAVLVGKPFSKAPSGAQYCTSVEKVLEYLSSSPDFDFHLGVIGIHTRKGEANRIMNKFIAAGNRLFVIGQFLDDVQPMLEFMDEIVTTFEKSKLDLNCLQWNVGLSIFGLKTRDFHANLLRKKQLACEELYSSLKSADCRVSQSIAMNMEFVEQLNKRAKEVGFNIGYSIQPIIERFANGKVHPSTYGAVTLARYVSASIS